MFRELMPVHFFSQLPRRLGAVFATLSLLLVSVLHAAELPPDLSEALQNFRSDPPKGWSYTLTTEGEGKSTVERANAARPEFDRWSLLKIDGRTPNAEELARYGNTRSQRSRSGTAPNIIDQLDYSQAEIVNDGAETAVLRFRLRPGESRDKTAEFLRATLTLHKPTKTIQVIELANAAEFSPTLGVKIAEVKTVMTYSLPAGDTPSLPQKVITRQRGTAFWFKSLDADMTVTFSDYERVGKRPGL